MPCFIPTESGCVLGDGQRLAGTEYLVCKQVIRDHDEYGGRRGCRINANPWQEKEERDSVCGLPCRLDKRNNELE